MQLPKLSELQVYYSNEELMLAVLEQLTKDFSMIKVSLVFDKQGDESCYLQLYREVYPVIEWLLEEQTAKLYNLLYQVDINESLIQRSLDDNPQQDFAVVITDLILKRILQKVVIRWMYSGRL